MGIREQVAKDLTAAMKARDSARTETLRLIRAEVLKKEKEKGAKDVDDAIMVQLLRSMVRQHQESIEQFEKGDREDLVAKERAQLEIVESYLPAPVDESVVDQIITDVIAQTGATGPKDIGKVMGQVMRTLKESGGLVWSRQRSRPGSVKDKGRSHREKEGTGRTCHPPHCLYLG